MPQDEESMEYEGEEVEKILVSFDEDNKVFYMEVNEEYGFVIEPQLAFEFIDNFAKVINELMNSTFKSSVNSLMQYQRKPAKKVVIEDGDEVKAVAAIEDMLKKCREDNNGPLAA
jgi:hypothetical protein